MTTYYMRADGTAANKGAASGPGSSQSACMSITTHNSETFSAGDVILMCDDGGDFQTQMQPPSSGASGNPITYQPESGDSPVIDGGTIRDFCIVFGNPSNAQYVTIDGIDCKDAADNCIKVTDTSRGIIIQDLTLDNAANSNYLQTGTGPSDTQLLRVVSSNAGGGVGDHGFYMNTTDETNGPFFMEDCQGDNNAGYGFHFYQGTGGTVRRCIAINNAKGGFLCRDSVAGSEFNHEYCISYGGAIEPGFKMGTFNNGTITARYYNCTSHDNANGGFEIDGTTVASSGVVMRNCISYANFVKELYFGPGQSGTYDLDYNCYYKASGTMIDWDNTVYTQAQFATFQSAKSQEANGISADPLFVDAASNDYHLKSSSPCIDAGLTVILGEYLDFDKVPVGRGVTPNMGSYEGLKGGPRAI